MSLLSTVFLLGGNAQALADSVAQIASPANAESLASPGEQPISETKRLLIYQLLEITGGRQQYEQINQILFTQMQQQIQPMLEQMVRSRGNLSPTEEQAMITNLNTNISTLITRFGETMRTEITYDEVLERVYYPTYDQYFTEKDLNNLIAFYQTPTGERLVAVSPQLFQTSLQLSNEVFMPKILEILGQLMQEQVEQIR